MAIQSYASFVSNSYTLKSFSQTMSQGPKIGNQPADALSSLQNKAFESLAREIPGMESKDLKALDAAEYTPEKVAARIGKFVAAGLESAKARGRSEEEVQALYDSAMKGVKQGFEEAKDILKNLDMLNGNVKDQVEATEKATFDTLAELAPNRKAQSAGGTKAMAAAVRYERADDFELTLQTRDGDTVRVSFSQDLNAQGSFAYAQDDQGNRAAVMDLSRSEQSGYSFSVEGDLSVEEIDAIQALVQDVGEVANDFFAGDVQKAFEQVSDVSFDSSQLSSMNLHMSRSEQYSAAQAYQETQQIDNPEHTRHGRRLGHLMRDFSDSFQKPGLDFLSQVDKIASRIMEGLVEQDTRFKDVDADQQGAYKDNLERMLSSFESVD
ncbi:hypothetical protein G3480_17460 [Thiorhodococcus mannitoliphagus]|uniref:DUF5610 domain-containing protein n=1 Tax=Thiorhodococcus mannitoliphagus TaxID=329406 RepID=A0A6P1DYB2_9GAMM|nr:DUF5610 domain-containing protein [Thiorhodococcus mannitoliphagus]NEX22073.1 hypothetical protein [Thiorhodococcus mannitoliphagus]